MKKIATVLGAILFVLLSVFSSYSGETMVCSKDEAEKMLETFLEKSFNIQGTEVNIKYEVFDVKKVEEVSFPLCVVVYSLKFPPNAPEPSFKTISYYTDNVFFTGDMRILSNGNVVYHSQDLLQAYNKEYFEELSKLARESRLKTIAKANISLNTFGDLKKNASFVFASQKKDLPEIVVFADPLCSHCKNMVEVVNELSSEGKLKGYINLTPILGDFSQKVAVSIICDKKEDIERYNAYKSRYSSNNLCDKGKKDVEKNVKTFTSLGGRGVPLSFLRINSDVYVIEGAIEKDVLEEKLKK